VSSRGQGTERVIEVDALPTLVGDAGVVMDSVSAQGMTSALRDADWLAAAVIAGLGGSRQLDAALRDHQSQRDRPIRGMYDCTLRLAAFTPVTSSERRFLAAVAADQHETDRFLGAFAGIVPPEQYFTLRTALRVLGLRTIRSGNMRVGIAELGDSAQLLVVHRLEAVGVRHTGGRARQRPQCRSDGAILIRSDRVTLAMTGRCPVLSCDVCGRTPYRISLAIGCSSQGPCGTGAR
jgi:hypothetical protein